jgi:hypothetical protein
MKTNKLNPGIIIILLGIGSFLSVLFLSKWSALSAKLRMPIYYPYEVPLWGSVLSLILLLALCSISARIMLWGYSKILSPQHPKRIFIYGFVISVVGILIGMVPGIVQGQYLRKLLKDQLPNLSPAPGYTNFLSLGFEPVLFTCAVTTIVLLWIARRKKTNEAPVALLSYPYRRQDVLLIISTLVVYAFLIKSMLEFIMYSFYFWRFGFIG